MVSISPRHRSHDPQLRRQSRERREYIYKKSHESQERAIFERKQRIKDALASGKQLPTELRNDARTIGKDLVLDEAQKGAFCV
jgi:U3 small nucleolar ribonucleoprotein protein IMP4